MRRLVRRTAAVVAALVLAGCAGSGEDEGDGGSRPPSATTGTTGTARPVPVEFRRVITSSHLAGACVADGAGEPSAEACAAWAGFDCPGAPLRLDGDVLMACGHGDEADQPYLLAAAEIVGGVESAVPAHRSGAAQWEVAVELEPAATTAFADLTADLVANSGQLAIVVDAVVVAAPAVQTEITDGQVRLAGDYTETEAHELAGRLAP